MESWFSCCIDWVPHFFVLEAFLVGRPATVYFRFSARQVGVSRHAMQQATSLHTLRQSPSCSLRASWYHLRCNMFVFYRPACNTATCLWSLIVGDNGKWRTVLNLRRGYWSELTVCGTTGAQCAAGQARANHSIAGLIPQFLQRQAQVTLASLGWSHKSGVCTSLLARRPVCFCSTWVLISP